MNNTIVVTSIYSEFWGTEQFRKSCEMVGFPVHNAWNRQEFTGNGDVMQCLYEAYVELKDKYEYAIYSDGADTFFTKSFQPPSNAIVYSTEKQVWPNAPDLIARYEDYYKDKQQIVEYSPWLYLNGGNCCGPTELLVEFYERYGLSTQSGDVNGQRELSEAFLQAKKDKFPIYLDYECKYFQTTGFESEGDFRLAEDGKSIINNITGSRPAVLHGNGRTDMQQIYDRYKL